MQGRGRRRRRGCCPRVSLTKGRVEENRKRVLACSQRFRCKRRRTVPQSERREDFFEQLPDDLLLCILSKLSSRASSPADFVNVLATCKRLNGLGMQPVVLGRASPGALSVRASRWTESAHRFLKRCADAGNVEACFILGMIRFYCLESRGSGASLMAKAAIASHAPALYSLAVIQFNGSGGTKNDKDLRAGVALCARAASLGHIDALREFGHCLQDGYGVRQNVAEGRRFLLQANARELASVLSGGCCAWRLPAFPSHRHRPRCDPARFRPWLAGLIESRWQLAGCPLLSDFGCNVPAPEPHPANRFLLEWFAARPPEGGLRLCSHETCGRPETRKHEFRRCSVCGNVNYCSRACQALDWKVRHKHYCFPLDRWDEEEEEEGGDDEEGEEEEEEEAEGNVEEQYSEEFMETGGGI
ncbi:F-box protein [Nymphaea thermarum]|nr:F-box protein [Nymphaea thermarum]